MKPRSIYNLLILLRSVCKEPFESGLCLEVEYLRSGKDISQEEYKKLSIYIDKHRPKRGKLFDPAYASDSWYWERGLIKPRLAWLNHHIKLNTPKKMSRNNRIHSKFIAFLKKHKAIDNYLRELKIELARPLNQRWISYVNYEDITAFYDNQSPDNWILHGFTWANTKEGHMYWSDLHDLWKEIVKE